MRAPKKKAPPDPATGGSGTERQPALPPELPVPAAGREPHISLTPAAEARLSKAGQAPPAAAAEAEAGLPGWQSLGKGHKPTQSTGRQGPRERKVRW